MLDDRSERFRGLVASVLCKLGPAARSAAPILMQLLKEKKARSPELVIQILDRIGPDPKAVLPILTAALEDASLCDEALKAICNLGPTARDAIPAIERAIRNARANGKNRVYASFSLIDPLANLGGEVVPLLLEFLKEEDADFQSRSAYALGKIGPAAREAVPALTKILGHEDPSVRRDAARALWCIRKDVAGVPVLTALLKEEARYLAEPAAQSLGDMGPAAKASLPALREALSHPNPDVRYAAREAIGKIGGRGGEEQEEMIRFTNLFILIPAYLTSNSTALRK